ncbi:DNA-directed RNA polymerases I and III subunit RPAC2 [Hyphodiscus hymeniophilus]|uniref:DNA-directed RNA polymerases I and III subunit RPAC2 n=1 Tax=Hyphodiscus hymeniophilus TaxID=353542 RepID=A0A9P6VI59_9HELO|nr:DNA-directed RNA polymerases I and III subunit RPAC2 [Hyphodiscus hymeniophilus]
MPPKKKTPAADPVASQEEDVSMAEAPPEEPTEDVIGDDANPAILGVDEQPIRVLAGSSEKAASYEFAKEDHTLGNALRYIIMKNPDVEFCGYSIPHPSEAVMNVRIQTYEGLALDALEKGLTDLMDLCDVIAEKFVAAREDYTSEMQS